MSFSTDRRSADHQRTVIPRRPNSYVDMTGAGDDQVLLVRSYLNRGAALALVAVEGESLSIVAESPSIGRAFRWLNPVGVADFDGDGDREAAAVITPHIGGLLTLFRRDGHRLAPVAQARGFSNHAIGSRELGLSAILDANADGVADMAIPDARRSTLRVVSFAGGRFADLARIPHRSAVATAILAVDLNGDGRPDLIYGLADSTLVAVLFDG